MHSAARAISTAISVKTGSPKIFTTEKSVIKAFGVSAQTGLKTLLESDVKRINVREIPKFMAIEMIVFGAILDTKSIIIESAKRARKRTPVHNKIASKKLNANGVFSNICAEYSGISSPFTPRRIFVKTKSLTVNHADKKAQYTAAEYIFEAEVFLS